MEKTFADRRQAPINESLITDRLRLSRCHCLLNRRLHLLGRCCILLTMKAVSWIALGEDSTAYGFVWLCVCRTKAWQGLVESVIPIEEAEAEVARPKGRVA